MAPGNQEHQLVPEYDYKLLVVGDGCVGKTSFVKRYRTGELVTVYEPTMGADVNQVVLHTSSGIINFVVWDIAGQEKFGGLKDGYFLGARCAIIMFDLSVPNGHKSVLKWHADISRLYDDVLFVICGNKADLKPHLVTPKQIDQLRRKCGHYIELSVNRNINFEKPFLYLAQKLFRDQSVRFVEPPAPIPPAPMDDDHPNSLSDYMDGLRLAATNILPDDVEDNEVFN